MTEEYGEGFRGLLRRPATGLTIVGLLVVAACLVAYFYRTTPAVEGHAAIKMFCVDLSTDPPTELVKTSDELPPLLNAQGQPTIVGAVYYTFDGGKSKRLAYYQKFSPEAKRAMAKIRSNPAAGTDGSLNTVIDGGTYIRDPAFKGGIEEGWVLLNSEEATAIDRKYSRTPVGGKLALARPE